MTHKAMRKTIGSVIIILLIISMPRMQSIENTIAAHPWVGVLLFVCAVAYVLWGMFWD